MLRLIRTGKVKSAHDVSDGGLAVCLAEKIVLGRGVGMELTLPELEDRRLDAALFGEDHSRIVFTVGSVDAGDIENISLPESIEIYRIGLVTPVEGLEVEVGTDTRIHVDAAPLREAYLNTIRETMQRV
jgi:phosphoribosylformylglycinamidine synthase